MDIERILTDLRAERDQLDEAILSLERMAAGAPKRRGRPPAWLVEAKGPKPAKRGRPPGSRNKTRSKAPAETPSSN